VKIAISGWTRDRNTEANVKRLLGNYLERVGGDYSDMRFERMERTRVEYRGRELLESGSSVTQGFVLRILEKGGFASACFNDGSELDAAIRKAKECAQSMGSGGEMNARLLVPPPVEDEIEPTIKGDPRAVSLEEKMALLSSYNRLVMASRDMITTLAVYEEVTRERHFINSAGTYVAEPLVTASISIRMIAAGNGVLQNGRAVVGGSDGFERLLGREDVFLRKAEIVSRLLQARPVEAGTYNVVLNPEMTGVFIHEAFGHFSEADLIEHNPSLREKMNMDRRLGCELLTVCDDPTMPAQIGHYSYDDEGVAGRRVVLMQKGILRGRLHSMRTARSYGESLNGHAIAEDFRYPPIVRMGCIYVTPGDNEPSELLDGAGDGLYVLDAKGGQTSGENFTFGAQYGYLIRNGKSGAMVRDINLMGNLFETLFAVKGVGRDTAISEMGGCGKGQMNIRSAMGGPHILIKAVRVGGC